MIKPKSKRDEEIEGSEETLILTGAEESFETLVDFYTSTVAIALIHLRDRLLFKPVSQPVIQQHIAVRKATRKEITKEPSMNEEIL